MRKEKYIKERETKNGPSFEVSLKYYDIDGERKIYTKSFHSKHYSTKKEALQDAIKHRDEMLKRIDTVGIVSKKDIPTLLQVYQEKKELFPLSYQTEKKHDIFFNLSMKWLEDKPIDKISAKDITLSLNKMTEKDDLSIKRCFSIWRQIFKCAIINDYVLYDPTIKVIPPQSNKISKPRDVSMSCGLNEVLDALQNYGQSQSSRFNGTIISYALITMYFLGLRPSECFALEKDDFNFEKKTVLINKAVGSRKGEKVCVKKAKNPRSVRTLPIPDELIPFILEVMELQPSNLLFARYGGALNHAGYYPLFIHNACKKAGIEFRAYMLRHKFSTDLISKNVDIRTIQELMGHTDSSMTLSYARSTEQQKRNAINRKLS